MSGNPGGPGPYGDLWSAFTRRHALLFFLFLAGVLFADVLFTTDDVVLSAKGLDLYAGEMSSLEFQLRELRQGRLPLWNPHVFSGTPNLATPLYPSVLLGLFLPLTTAINLAIALHVFLLGFGMYLWSSSRGLHPLASLASGVLVMFSGSFFLHVYAGHLANLLAMAWVPLLFLFVDRVLEEPSAGRAAGGAVAAGLMILTGQYQYVYYTALAVMLYVLLRAGQVPAGRRLRALAALGGIGAGSVALSAFQLFPALAAGAESIRAVGVSREFAAMFSFPPENLLTLVMPFFFGNMDAMPYWGRWYLWEMCLFVGAVGLVLAVHGAAGRGIPAHRRAAAMVFLLLLLALGANTPLFGLLYEGLPGFGTFRGTSKFAFLAVLFLGLLAGVGMDRLLSRRAFPGGGVLAAALAGVGLLAASLWLFQASSPGAEGGLWTRIVQAVAATGESYFPPALYRNPAVVAGMAEWAALGALAAGVLFLLAALLLRLARRDVRAVYLLAILLLLEGFVFARMSRPVFHYRETSIPAFREFSQARPGDYRILNRAAPNTAMSTGSRDAWGYGPMVLKRYARFMAVTQGVDPGRASTYLSLQAYHPLWELLRIRYIMLPAQGGVTVREMEGGIPRVQLLTDWKVAKTEEDVFALLTAPSFDPRRTAILEGEPGIPPSPPGSAGNCSLRDDGSDRLVVRAETNRPSLLLVAENYSAGWRVIDPGPAPQSSYAVLPADGTLMAVPLAPGKHAFTLQYRPRAFIPGAWVSLAAWLFLGGWGLRRGLAGLRRSRAGRGPASPRGR